MQTLPTFLNGIASIRKNCRIVKLYIDLHKYIVELQTVHNILDGECEHSLCLPTDLGVVNLLFIPVPLDTILSPFDPEPVPGR